MGFLSHQLRYADKRFAITKMAGEVRDSRRRPEHRAPVVVRGLLVMVVARLGSINKLACAGANRLRAWIGGLLPSADTLGRASARLHADDVRGHGAQGLLRDAPGQELAPAARPARAAA